MKKVLLATSIAVLLVGCGSNETVIQPTENTKVLMEKLDPTKAPVFNFDLSKWKINLPLEDDKPKRAGKVMEIAVKDLNNKSNPYSHPDWFYTDPNTGAMVFVTPNKAMTTPNSQNTRSELRAMLGGSYKAPKNNFALAANPDANSYGSIGGQLTATLSVDWISTSGNAEKNDAFSSIIGQIHADKNEPLKIAYRKLPEHEHGSLYWRYEINAVGDHYGKRKDIYHNVFGQYDLRAGSSEPTDGIKLGEVFSYDVNVVGNVMNLTFIKNIGEPNEIEKSLSIDLSKPHYQGEEYDEGYANSWMYFKAGNNNQCNVTLSECTNNGIEAGDYAKVSFYQLELNQ